MNKYFIVTLGMILSPIPVVYAGGIDNKQNLSAKYLGSFTRNASIDSADAVFYNPAGVVRLKDGLHLQLDTQYILKDYSQEVSGETYKADDPTLMPSVAVVYKKNDWAGFASFHISGGGGKVDYENGNIITQGIGAGLTSFRLGITGIEDDWINAESLYYTYTLGGAWAVNEQWSIAAAGRYLNATKELEAGAGLTGSGPQSIDMGFEQSDDAFGYILGVNYAPIPTVNLAFRYESEMDIDWKTTLTSSDALGNTILGGLGYTDGSIHSRNLPAIVGLGAQWQVNDKWLIGSAFTMYLEKDADWDNNEKYVTHNSYDIAVSATYSLRENLRLSGGYMYTNVGLDPEYYTLTEVMSPVLNAHTIGTGISWDYNDRLTVTGGVAGAFYESATAESALGQSTRYDKTNILLGMGLSYRFF